MPAQLEWSRTPTDQRILQKRYSMAIYVSVGTNNTFQMAWGLEIALVLPPIERELFSWGLPQWVEVKWQRLSVCDGRGSSDIGTGTTAHAGLSAIKLHLKTMAPPRVFVCIPKVHCGPGSRQTAFFPWWDSMSLRVWSACFCPVFAREDTVPSSPLSPQLWDELTKGYSRGQLQLGLRFPALLLLKSKDMLNAIEGKHSRVLLALDGSILSYLAPKT